MGFYRLLYEKDEGIILFGNGVPVNKGPIQIRDLHKIVREYTLIQSK